MTIQDSLSTEKLTLSEIFIRCDSGYYRPKINYPVFPAKPILVTRAGSVASAADAQEWAIAMAEWEKQTAACDLISHEYHRLASILELEFMKDLADVHDMTGHPKALKLYATAYEMGHARGFSSVASYYADLVDLAR